MPIVKWQKWQKIWGQLTETLSQMAETPTQLTENLTQLTSENCLESFKSKNKKSPSFSPFFSKKKHTNDTQHTLVYALICIQINKKNIYLIYVYVVHFGNIVYIDNIINN